MGVTGECAHVAVPADGAALVVDAFDTAQSLRVVLEKGRLLPLHCTSVGKCLLAWELAPIPADLPVRTGRTVTDPLRLRADLELARTRGYAMDDEENHTGGRGISAPVFEGREGPPVGCVGIGGPVQRMRDDLLGGLSGAVIDVAGRLSAAIAAAPPPTGD